MAITTYKPQVNKPVQPMAADMPKMPPKPMGMGSPTQNAFVGGKPPTGQPLGGVKPQDLASVMARRQQQAGMPPLPPSVDGVSNPTGYAGQAYKVRQQLEQQAVERQRNGGAEPVDGNKPLPPNVGPGGENPATTPKTAEQLLAEMKARATTAANTGYETGLSALEEQRKAEEAKYARELTGNLETMNKNVTDNALSTGSLWSSKVLDKSQRGEADLRAANTTAMSELGRVLMAEKGKLATNRDNSIADASTKYDMSTIEALNRADDKKYQEARDLIQDEQWNKTFGLQMTEAQNKQTQQALDNAWNKVNTIGKVDAETAKILGIPEGTPTYEAYKWQTAFDYGKTQDALNRKGSGGTYTPTAPPTDPLPTVPPTGTKANGDYLNKLIKDYQAATKRTKNIPIPD
jgi:hypothetical protein